MIALEKAEKIWNWRFILLFITNLLVLAAFYASIPIIPVYCQEIGITGSKVGIVVFEAFVDDHYRKLKQ